MPPGEQASEQAKATKTTIKIWGGTARHGGFALRFRAKRFSPYIIHQLHINITSIKDLLRGLKRFIHWQLPHQSERGRRGVATHRSNCGRRLAARLRTASPPSTTAPAVTFHVPSTMDGDRPSRQGREEGRWRVKGGEIQARSVKNVIILKARRRKMMFIPWFIPGGVSIDIQNEGCTNNRVLG